jgi:Family of unknown function (DUF6221)
MHDLVEWLETAISERERLAWGACKPGMPTDAGPEAWRWFDTDSEPPRLVDPKERGASLCSVQQYPAVSSPSVSIAHYVISFSYEAEVDVGVAAFLPFNDPAAVLRRCAADRKILAAVRRGIEGHPGPCVNREDQDPRHYSEYEPCERHIRWSDTTLPLRAARLLAEGYGYQEATNHG